MDYRVLGRSGLRVSTLCLGTMMFGGRTDPATALRIISRAREAGVNFIDTADVYNDGRAEEVVGQALKQGRDRWIVATKLGNPFTDEMGGRGINARGLNRVHVARAIDASLKRLGLAEVDVLYLHLEDLRTPLESTVRALEDALRAGKVRGLGLSNFRAWRIAEVCRLCDEANIDRPWVLQPYYNAFNRMPEVEMLPAAGHFGLGVVPYSPLARGVLTAKYQPQQAPSPDTRAGVGDMRMMQTEWRDESLVLAQKLRSHALRRGLSAVQFAVAWVLANPLITAAIAGPRTEEQWKDYLEAVGVTLTPEDEALVDSLVAPGHPSTPGYNDPAYPIEGRPTGG